MPRSQIDNDIRASILTIAFAPIQIPKFRIGSVSGYDRNPKAILFYPRGVLVLRI